MLPPKSAFRAPLSITSPNLPRRSFLALSAGALVAACEPGGFAGPSIDTRAPVPVALLVPGGSGQAGDEALARALENAAQMAVADLQGAQIDLRVYNTAGRPEVAAQQASQAIADGARLILGPVFAAEARAVGPAAAARSVNVLSFSNNMEVAGGNIFILGPTFRNTANRLVSYAAGQGKSRILVVHERTPAGEQGRAAIQLAASQAGVTLAGVEGFDFSQQGVVEALPRISERARAGADAVFFTSDTAGALPLLAQLLPENRVGPDRYQYIGLTRWDIPPETLEMSGVQGGWFALPDPGLTARFNARFAGRFGRDPHPIAPLAYDGVAAIGALIARGQSDALTRGALTEGRGFAGASGIFRLLSDGTNERGLAVATIRDRQVQVIDAAPTAFVGAGA